MEAKDKKGLEETMVTKAKGKKALVCTLALYTVLLSTEVIHDIGSISTQFL